jgi:hypothetical protein
MTTPELKSCPFCGGEARIQEGGDKFYVVCLGENCFCAVGERYDRDAMPDHMFDDAEAAITAWNTRPKEGPAHSEAVEAARRRLRLILEHAKPMDSFVLSRPNIDMLQALLPLTGGGEGEMMVRSRLRRSPKA